MTSEFARLAGNRATCKPLLLIRLDRRMKLNVATSWAGMTLAASVICLSADGGEFIERVGNASLRMPREITDQSALPQTLADTGAFADLATLTPESGIVPFEINVALWSDGAHKRRWFAIPDANQRIVFSRDGFWSYPTGMVWIKHFELELTNGVPDSARRLETRFLVRTAAGVYGVTYRWDDSQTNATLVPAEGMDETFFIHENGAVREQTWHYPTRYECLTCHNPASGYALGFNTAQLNCNLEYERPAHADTKLINQLLALSDAGYFQSSITNIHTLRALVPATNTAVSVEYRVRSYLSANCVHCHQPGAPCGFTVWNAQLTNSLPQTKIINGRALMNFGDPENCIVTPGKPEKSVLFTRVANMGPHHMPMLCTGMPNNDGIALLRSWIAEDLARYQSFADWQTTHFGNTNVSDAAPHADADGDGAPNYLEYLTAGNPLLPTDSWRLSLRPSNGGMEIRFPRAVNRGYEVQWTTNLADPNSWQPLDVSDNRPFFSAVAMKAVVRDPDQHAAAKFYRVRVYEP